jgi:hypothetical protein
VKSSFFSALTSAGRGSRHLFVRVVAPGVRAARAALLSAAAVAAHHWRGRKLRSISGSCPSSRLPAKQFAAFDPRTRKLFALGREQGRLKEVEPAIPIFIQQHSAAAACRPGLAVIYSELGRTA